MLDADSFIISIITFCRRLLGSAVLWLWRCSLHWPSKSSGVTSFCKTSLQALKFDLIDKLLTRVNCRATGIAKKLPFLPKLPVKTLMKYSQEADCKGGEKFCLKLWLESEFLTSSTFRNHPQLLSLFIHMLIHFELRWAKPLLQMSLT